MSKTAKRLGRGLSTLISDLRAEQERPGQTPRSGFDNVPMSKEGPVTAVVNVGDLVPNPFQPRERIPDVSLIQLAESLRRSGMIQAITVREAAGKYQIIAGERRWRAAKLAGITKVPVVIRPADDRDMLELALVENIQREDLNPIDRAKAYRQYCDRFGCTAEDIAQRLAEDRSTAANYLRLLDLEDDIQAMVADGRLTMGHARCIVGVAGTDERRRLARAVVAHELSVRALEGIVRREKGTRPQGSAGITDAPRKTPHLRDLEERLSIATGTKVTIQEGRRKGTGRLVIEYYSLDDFERIAARLGVSSDA